jgi:sulfate adenylyltransferase
MTENSRKDRIGLSVLFTGLSGAGKTTTASALKNRLFERRNRPVTLLDGEAVRTGLSAELGFSKEDRDIHIRRIGFVASEITKHGGLCICAAIAPYDAARKEMRAMIESIGGFVLVHVATPLSVCEMRDRKGLYVRARNGTLPQFTGVSDPYEKPADAEITIDTSCMTCEEAVDIVARYLERRGFI